MKKLAVLQIVLGILIVLCSLVSVSKVRLEDRVVDPGLTEDPSQIVLNSVPPNDAVSELLTLGLGLAVIGFGIVQRKLHAKLGGWQILFGAAAAFSSAAISIAIIDNPWVTGNVFYYTYLILAFGLVIAAVGLAQMKEVTAKLRGNLGG